MRFSGGSFLAGLAIGAGVVLAGTDKWQSMRPLAKGAMRAGVHGFRAAQRMAAQASEEFEDLLAETLHEIDGETPPPIASADDAR